MIAMNYGCIPIAHATGGLSDTIKDPSKTDQSTGFLFKPAKSDALTTAIQRALLVYRSQPAQWQEMQIRGMQQDFSWDKSAAEYLEQYKRLLSRQKDTRKYV
jgi:starch synthase